MSAVPRAAGPALTALTALTLVWLGLLLGVSFVATPVKFLAPSLSLPVALDVGRQTFWWLGRIELVVAVAALGIAASLGVKEWATSLTAVLVAAVVAQVFWLLPLLDARVEIILQGGTPPPSAFHAVYIAVEVAKVVLLVALAWIALARLRRSPA